MSDDDEMHRRHLNGMRVYLIGPYWANKDGTGKAYTKASYTDEEFAAYYVGDSAEKNWRIKNSDGDTIGFTTDDNFEHRGPAPP